MSLRGSVTIWSTIKGGYRWSVVVAVAGVVVAAMVEVAAVVVVTMAVVLISPPTLYKPSATVLFHFVSKLIFS